MWTKNANQMGCNFIETLINLAKTPLTKDEIRDVGEIISGGFVDDPEVIDTAQIILLVAGGAPICFTCGRPVDGCECGEAQDIIQIGEA